MTDDETLALALYALDIADAREDPLRRKVAERQETFARAMEDVMRLAADMAGPAEDE